MADNNRDALPEGTHTVIEGAALTNDGSGGAGGATITVEDTATVIEREIVAPAGGSESAVIGSSNSEAGLTDRLRSGGERLSSQAGERARGLVTQGLERTAEALAGVSRMVGDTADGIDERLGSEYGEYARRAAGAIENAANSLAEKDPDELIDDTRTFVRNSPGLALAGAAVVGFVVARLIKSGLGAKEDEGDRA